ncbi:ferredoxin [Acaryochloris sp. CCMEE 5410]|uniref:ferredoxin n=1 Tax=Acaryochloris sp. CCMEE 5410 TaxID=310037 RepID=UPI0002483F47|nr:ferredoxin [Acaryochloris sp. CCMEE 5410]KAI9131457.1 ferredoxin [Acaryochloris sp. CCMEE 5410]
MTDLKNAGVPDGTPKSTQPASSRSGLEPELGGGFRTENERTGLEPELGGVIRQKGVYVDEPTCIGCKHCAHVARNTFYIEPGYGRSRVFRQDGDAFEIVQEAIDTCPVDCIHWVDYTQLQQLEADRKYQQVNILGSQIPATYTKRVVPKKAGRKPRPISLDNSGPGL